jgi:hypothetical protein
MWRGMGGKREWWRERTYRGRWGGSRRSIRWCWGERRKEREREEEEREEEREEREEREEEERRGGEGSGMRGGS